MDRPPRVPQGALGSPLELQARLDLIEGLTGDVVFRYRLGGSPRYEYVSASIERVSGYTAEEIYRDELVGRSIVVDEDRPLLAAAVVGEVPSPVVLRWCHRDGRRRWVEHRFVPVLDESGAQVAVEGTARDVTEHAGMSQLLEHVLGSELIGVLITDVHGTVEVASTAVCHLLGYEEGELVGRSVVELLHPDDRAIRASRIAALVSGTAPGFTADRRYQHRDGGTVHASIAVTRYVDGNEEVHLVGVLLDRTEVVASRTEASSARRRLAALVEHSADLVVVVDRGLDVTYASPSASRILGAEPSELAADALDVIHPEDRASVVRSLQRVMADDRTHRPIQFRALHADGSVRVLEALGTNRLDDPAVQGVVVNARDITERLQIEAELERRRFHDELTGLPNRGLVEQHLRHALDARAEAGLAFVDLDRFHLVNESFGHDVGDAVIVQLTQRLQRVVAPGDTLARWGPDQLAVVAADLDRPAAEALVEQILAQVRSPFHLAGHEMRLTASVGVALVVEADADVPDLARSLTQSADAALASAKDAGGDRGSFATADHQRHARARLELEAALRRAVDAAGELVPHYQPIVEPGTGRVLGAEALVRWDRPGHGVLAAGEFIPQAERSELIIAIDDLVLRTACSELARWRRDLDPALRLSTNISGRHLSDPGLARRVESALAAAGIDAPSLTLEITETAFVEDDAGALESLARLRSLGVKVAIDDFGTGFSSLARLKGLPVDVLKIDRSFVAGLLTDPDDAAIVRATISLARSLGLAVVAEGVESGAQASRLAALGCDQAQGYCWAPPLPGPAFREQVRQARLAGGLAAVGVT